MYHLYEYVRRYIHNLIQRTHNHFLHFADIHHYSMQVLFYPLLLNIVKKASQRANQRSLKSSHENARYKKQQTDHKKSSTAYQLHYYSNLSLQSCFLFYLLVYCPERASVPCPFILLFTFPFTAYQHIVPCLPTNKRPLMPSMCNAVRVSVCVHPSIWSHQRKNQRQCWW